MRDSLICVPQEITPGSEIDAVGPRGTAIVFHGRAIYAGKA
jgi:hypothetical protein